MAVSFPRLAQKCVCITGASSGIGRSAALLFAQSGANVILIARRKEKLEELSKEIKAANNVKVACIAMDVTDRKRVDGLLNELPAEFRAVDVLVNNAGGAMGTAQVGETLEGDIDYMIDVNVKSVMHLTQVFVRHFKEQNRGHFIMIGSVAGVRPRVLPRGINLVRELYNTPLRVTEIQPGLVETEFSVVRFKGDQSKADKVYEGMTPMTPNDIAEEIVWCASRPPHVNIAELFVMPTAQAGPGLVHRAASK